MIFADTNLVSEIVRPKPNAGVIAWIAAHEDQLHLSTVVIAEISFGIERIRPQERAKHLTAFLEEILSRYAKRLHGFDVNTALIFGRLMGEASRRGRTLSAPDGMIAATALQHNAALATRDAGHFDVEGLSLVDPWR